MAAGGGGGGGAEPVTPKNPSSVSSIFLQQSLTTVSTTDIYTLHDLYMQSVIPGRQRINTNNTRLIIYLFLKTKE